MMSELFAYPKSAAFGRIVSKEAIYRHGALSTAAKNLFVRQIERIIWQFKLAPETINLPGTYATPEIQIFSLHLKQEECAPDIFVAIDKAVQYPILFELCYQDKVKTVAAYKRPADTSASGDSPNKWVASKHFEGSWLAADSPRVALPQALNLEMLYTALLMPLLPNKMRPDENLVGYVDRIETIDELDREIARLTARLQREKQFNRKIELNQKIREIKSQLAGLIE